MLLRFATTYALVATTALAQQPRTVTLGSPLAVHPEPFSLVTSVRELRDGRVVVADPIDRTLSVLDASLQGAQRIGREGAGPAEFRQPDSVWPWPGDSTLVVDLGNTRLTVVAPNGQVARSFSMFLGEGAPGTPPVTLLPAGIDAAGRVYFQPPGRGAPGSPPSDTGVVLRYAPASGRVDTVARVKLTDVRVQQSGGDNDRNVRISPVPLSASDGWAVGATGDVAVVRSGDYHVDWMGASGPVRRGRPAPAQRVRIGNAEKLEWIEEQQLRGGIGMSVSIENGQRTMSMSRARGPQRPDPSAYEWPETKPYFDPVSPRVDARGRVWVRRHVAAGRPPMYDVFAADGAHAGVVTFPANRILAGFGNRGLYAVHADEDGLQTLERYALPF